MLGPENPFGPSRSMEMTVPGVFPIQIQFIKLWKLCFLMLPGSWPSIQVWSIQITKKLWKSQYLGVSGYIWWYLNLYQWHLKKIWYYLICKKSFSMYFGKFEFGISPLKNNKLNLPIESFNIALFKHYIENMITFLG